MNRGAIVGCVAVLGACATAVAQTPLERGRYLVDTVMTCHNCHTPRGPNGFQFDKALSGGLRFDEPPFDVWATNISPIATPASEIGATRKSRRRCRRAGGPLATSLPR